MFRFKEESCTRQSCLPSSLANIVGVTKWVWQELHFVIPTILEEEEEDWSGLFFLWSVCQGITLIDLSQVLPSVGLQELCPAVKVLPFDIDTSISIFVLEKPQQFCQKNNQKAECTSMFHLLESDHILPLKVKVIRT
jgi:hypothetical protein